MPKIIENAENKIIIEGRRILLKDGYKALSIREIAKQCNIGTGTFYNYFTSKETLAVAIFNDDWNQCLLTIKTLKASNIVFKEKIKIIYNSLEGFVDRYMAIFYEMVNSSECKHKDSYIQKEIYLELSEIIEEEIKKGNITSSIAPIKLSEFILSNLFSITKTRFITFDEFYNLINL